MLAAPQRLMIHSLVIEDISRVEQMLAQVPSSLWTKDEQDTRLMVNVAPVVVHLKEGRLAPKILQYALKPEVELGVFPVIERLLQQGT